MDCDISLLFTISCSFNESVYDCAVFVLFVTAFIITFITRTIKRRKKTRLSVLVISSANEIDKACRTIIKDCEYDPVLGFDAEWIQIKGKRQPVALLQLCTAKGTCVLFRLCRLQRFPKNLTDLLESRKIIKVGVDPFNDSKLLLQDYGISVNGTLDLRFLYPTYGGLAHLSKSVLGLSLDKSYRVRCSNWEAPVLTHKQIEYAAMDACVGVEIFKDWRCKRRWTEIFTDTGQLIDVPFKNSPKDRSFRKSLSVRKKLPTERMATRKRIYDNCLMLAPDGELLNTIRKSKLDWYLKMNAAELVSSNPETIRLLFEPKRRPGVNSQYFKERKQDLCVVCGATHSLVKHCVVPRKYTKHFPHDMKSHCSHDILVLCLSCHLIADRHSTRLTKDIEKQLKIKHQYPHNRKLKIQRLACALKEQGHVIPEKRRLEMEKEIMDQLGITEITEEVFENLAAQSCDDIDDISAVEKITLDEYISTGKTILDFQKLWRQYFIDKMAPEYLPKFWSVNHEN